MTTFYRKLTVLFIAVFGLMVLPLQAQQTQAETEEPFIQQGDFLTGFSLGFTNTTVDSSASLLGDEFSRLLINLDGLYFISDHFGIGPLLGYQFNFRDLNTEETGLEDTRNRNFKFGAKAGWYTSANELFNTSSLGRAQFFVDGGLSWIRNRAQVGSTQSDADYDFGYQIGAGFLFPVGQQAAIETKLGFMSRQEDYLRRGTDANGQTVLFSKTKWMEDITLSIGFKVML